MLLVIRPAKLDQTLLRHTACAGFHRSGERSISLVLCYPAEVYLLALSSYQGTTKTLVNLQFVRSVASRRYRSALPGFRSDPTKRGTGHRVKGPFRLQTSRRGSQ